MAQNPSDSGNAPAARGGASFASPEMDAEMLRLGQIVEQLQAQVAGKQNQVPAHTQEAPAAAQTSGGQGPAGGSAPPVPWMNKALQQAEDVAGVRSPFANLHALFTGSTTSTNILDQFARENRGAVDPKTGRVIEGMGFRTNLEDIGPVHVGEFADVGQRAATLQQQSTARIHAMTVQGMGYGAGFLTSPTHDPEGRLAQGAGGALSDLAVSGALGKGGPWGAAAGAALQVGGATSEATKGRLQAFGNQYAPLERPREVLAHLGADVQAGEVLSAKYGFNEAESTYRLTDFMRGVGGRVSKDEFAGMKDLPFQMELQGLQPGVGAHFAAQAFAGGGSRSGVGGTLEAMKEAQTTASAMGLTGDRQTEYLSRIAATLQGFAERGFKIDADAVNEGAKGLAAVGLAAAEGDERTAYLQGQRAVVVQNNLRNAYQGASGMLGGQQQSGQVMRGMALRTAVEELQGRGEAADYLGVGKELQSLQEDEGGVQKLMQHSLRYTRQQREFAFRDVASPKEAALMAADPTGTKAVEMMERLSKGKDDVVPGSKQDVLAARTENEKLLVRAIQENTKELKVLNATESFWQRAAVRVGGALTGTQQLSGGQTADRFFHGREFRTSPI